MKNVILSEAKDLNEDTVCAFRSAEILRASSSDALRMTRFCSVNGFKRRSL